jgi:ABC-type ATPase involved in cell division
MCQRELHALELAPVVREDGPAPEYFAKDLAAELHSIEISLNQITNDYRLKDSQYQSALKQVDQQKEHLEHVEQTYSEKLARLNEPSTICHLCKGTIVDTEAYELNKVRMITGLDSREAFERAHLEDVRLLQKGITDWEARANALNEELSGLFKRTDELVKYQEDIKQKFTYATEYEAWENHMQRVQSYKDQIAQLQGHLKQLEDNPPATEDLHVVYKQQQSILQSYKTNRAKLIAEINDLKAGRAMHEMSLEENTKLAHQYEVNKEARQVLVKLRDVFSQHRVQARYLKSKISELNDKIAEFLRLTDMPFSLTLNEDTHVFEYVTAEGFTHPAAHLSGAQKNISAVVLQMAIFEVVQPNINLFLVDEPSESLDDENKIIMADLFQRMNRMLPAIEGTMMIVSRDMQLIDSCENVLNVSEV